MKTKKDAAAVALGRKGLGKPKRFTKAQIARLTARIKAAKRWPTTKKI
jgi:hypothetical protein